MDFNWTKAITIGGPSVIAAYIFHSLIMEYMKESEIFKDNLALNITLLVVIFSFCSFIGWILSKKNSKNQASETEISENEITNNKGKSLEIGTNDKSKNIVKNKISGNTIDGDIKIGL